MDRSLLTRITWTSVLVVGVSSHGYMVAPPGRASAWRYGFHTPIDYNDNQQFCGGFWNQWHVNHGRCGVCGDPWQGPREHEAGGKYATGVIVRKYKKDSTITIKIKLTANHKGWFEFRLCPNNNPHVAVSQDCLDRYPLRLKHGALRYLVEETDRLVTLQVALPLGLTCTQCLLQWKYNAGNSWGTDPLTGRSCVGCGPQEQFYACADIAIQ